MGQRRRRSSTCDVDAVKIRLCDPGHKRFLICAVLSLRRAVHDGWTDGIWQLPCHDRGAARVSLTDRDGWANAEVRHATCREFAIVREPVCKRMSAVCGLQREIRTDAVTTGDDGEIAISRLLGTGPS
jgi:hypothetical protein